MLRPVSRQQWQVPREPVLACRKADHELEKPVAEVLQDLS